MALYVQDLAAVAPTSVRLAVGQASDRTGVGFSYLMAKAAAESSFDADAAATTSSARGLYQFIERTWLDTVARHGADHGLAHEAEAIASGDLDEAARDRILALRNDPGFAALMAAELAQDNREHLLRTVGGPIGDTELYLAHFLGAGGAARFIEAWRDDPEAVGVDLFPKAAAANRSVFHDGGRARSLDEIRTFFAGKFGDGEAVTAARERPFTGPDQIMSDSGPDGVPARAFHARVTRPAVQPVLSQMAPPATLAGETAFRVQLMMSGLPLPGERGALS